MIPLDEATQTSARISFASRGLDEGDVATSWNLAITSSLDFNLAIASSLLTGGEINEFNLVDLVW
jgi:hypothetical protein